MYLFQVFWRTRSAGSYKIHRAFVEAEDRADAIEIMESWLPENAVITHLYKATRDSMMPWDIMYYRKGESYDKRN